MLAGRSGDRAQRSAFAADLVRSDQQIALNRHLNLPVARIVCAALLRYRQRDGFEVDRIRSGHDLELAGSTTRFIARFQNSKA